MTPSGTADANARAPGATAPVGLGLVGVGRWGMRLAGAAGRASGVRVTRCFARDPAARAKAADTLACRPAASVEALLEDPEVEAVVLATPNHAHEALAVAAAAHGKHVFVEKPIATEPGAADRMAEACRAAGVTLQVGHCFRRLGASRAAATLVARGRLGKVVLAEASFSLPGAFAPGNWRASRATLAGGPLIQLGVHHADTLLAWLGPAVRVSGSLTHLAAEVDIDDVAVAVLEHAAGARSVIACSYVSPKTYRLRLYGTEANLELRTDMSLWPNAERMDAGTTLTLEHGGAAETLPFEPVDMLVDELEELARCVRSGSQPETGAAEGAAALEVVLGAIRSSQAEGAAQPLSDRSQA